MPLFGADLTKNGHPIPCRRFADLVTTQRDTLKFYITSKLCENLIFDANFIKTLKLDGKRRIIKSTECVDSLPGKYVVRLCHAGHIFFECEIVKSKKGDQLNLIVNEFVDDLQTGLYDKQIDDFLIKGGASR